METCGFLVTAPASGSGKTIAACALMAGFQQMHMNVRACKCGPDYIDPMFHKEVLKVYSRNLDLYFLGEREELQKAYKRHISGADIVIAEGVMGYYDGISFGSYAGSTYEIGKALSLPAILILPCKGMAASALALLKGFLEYQADSNIRGIILNRISLALYPRMKEMMEQGLREMGYKAAEVLGYLPEEPVFHLESRHLGLCLPKETERLSEQMEQAGKRIRETVDMERLLAIAGYQNDGQKIKHNASQIISRNQPQERKESEPEKEQNQTEHKEAVYIAVAKDLAFCFYYQENLEYLESLGCELVFFSPLMDGSLPENCGGLLLGGGYPEVYAEELSANRKLLSDIREKIREGLPCLAECGGFQYLQERLEGSDGRLYTMAGIIPSISRRKENLVRFGYVDIRGRKDGMYLKQGESIKGHEFHYWDSSDNGKDCLAVKPEGRRSWDCIHMKGSLFAGYPHLYYPSNPEFAARFVKTCRAYRRKKGNR